MQQAPPEERPPVAAVGERPKLLPHTDKSESRPLRLLAAAEVRRLLCSIETRTEEGLRDLAMLALMIHGFLLPGALPALRVSDYERDGAERWLTLNARARPSRPRRIPVRHPAAAYLDAYLVVSGIAGDAEGLLFRSAQGCGGPRPRLATGRQVLRMARWRAGAAGLSRTITHQTLRATGLMRFLDHGGHG